MPRVSETQLECLAQALATGSTLTKAAAMIPITFKTALIHSRKPPFKSRVAQIQDGMLAEVQVGFAKHLTAAAEVLFETLTAERVERRTKIVAAKAIMDYYLKIRTALETDRLYEEMDRRVRELEAQKTPSLQAGAAA